MQASFSELEYAAKKKPARRDRFLLEIEAVTPWVELERTVTPFYPCSGGRGRPPIGWARIRWMYVAQQCFGFSDEGGEDALYDSQAIRRFVGIDLNRESAPDATTLLNFRHLLESHQLSESIFNTLNGHLAAKGLLLREGTIVDATLIAAPPSTKNKGGRRDPEMHPSKKGKQWYFGMKTPIGVDAQSGQVHTLIGTSRCDPTNARHCPPRPWVAFEHTKAGISAKVEHPFHVVKNLFRHRKTRYKGLGDFREIRPANPDKVSLPFD